MAKLTIFRFRGHVSREERFRQLFVEIYPRLVRYAIQLMGDRGRSEGHCWRSDGRGLEMF